MSLLTMCQDAADEIGIKQPATIIGNTDSGAKQLFILAKRATRSLARSYPWQALCMEGTITLVDGTQTYTLASDFWWMISDTMWDRTNDRIALYPVTAREWANLKGWDIGVSGINKRARLYGNVVEFYETIGTGDDGDVFNYEYVSKNIIDTAAGGGEKVEYTVDTDVPEFLDAADHDLITQGIVWRYKQARGLPFQAELAEYQSNRDRVIGRDGQDRSLNLRGGYDRPVIGAIIPDQDYG